jgi:hypothetical protein
MRSTTVPVPGTGTRTALRAYYFTLLSSPQETFLYIIHYNSATVELYCDTTGKAFLMAPSGFGHGNPSWFAPHRTKLRQIEISGIVPHGGTCMVL